MRFGKAKPARAENYPVILQVRLTQEQLRFLKSLRKAGVSGSMSEAVRFCIATTIYRGDEP